jgi:integrase
MQGQRKTGDAGRWEGGRIYTDGRGKKRYEIRRSVNGVRYEVATGCTTMTGALAELRRFERDPTGYHPGGDPQAAPVSFTNTLCEDYLAYSLHSMRDGGKENTLAWAEKKRNLLAWWRERLGEADLRRLTRHQVDGALEGAKSRAHRIAVLKHFYSWLRKRGLITHSEDVMLDVAKPTPRPAQWDRSKVIPREHYLLVREHLTGQIWKDAITILAGTGWHMTELVRFARNGSIEPLSKGTKVEYGAVAALVCPMHKSGDAHRTAVSQEVLDAAERLRKTGWPKATESSFEKAVKSACRAAKIPVFTPGRFRHSVATWAVEKGAPLSAVAAFLGHKSPQTTKRFYATMAVVPKVPTLS